MYILIRQNTLTGMKEKSTKQKKLIYNYYLAATVKSGLTNNITHIW